MRPFEISNTKKGKIYVDNKNGKSEVNLHKLSKGGESNLLS